MDHSSTARKVLPVVLALVITTLAAGALGQMHPVATSRAASLGALIATPTCVPYPAPGQPLCPPPPTATKSPSPSPTPGPSAEAQKALAYLAEREKIALQDLALVNEFRRESALLGRTFQAVTVVELKGKRRFFKLLVNRQTGEVSERETIERAEERARQARYGKLQPALYDHLQKMKDDERVTVMIWIVARPGQSMAEREVAAKATLAAKYPEVRAALERSGKPMDVADRALAQRIYSEYVQLLEDGMDQHVQPLVRALEIQGLAVRMNKGLPAITVTLTKKMLLQVAQREDVGIIGLAEGKLELFLNSAMQTNLAPAVWAQGYDGTGTSVAIVDKGNVDFTSNTAECPASTNNCFLRPGTTRVGMWGEHFHATLCASAAASNHPTYRGMARGATVISAGITQDTEQGAVDALVWALDRGAAVVNYSGGLCTTQMGPFDWAFDHYARYRFTMIVAAAGNRSQCTSEIVASPAKGWNVLSVGAYDDRNNANWSDDAMWNDSVWRNPASPNYDHEKPEVVAPGVGITAIEMDGRLLTLPGTSLAAPQVAGLAALLIHRNSSLADWPEASRAIIMASAAHNIVGPTGIFSGEDLRDGAGGIVATFADDIARVRNHSDTSPCTTSCWWGNHIDNTTFPVGGYLFRYFTATQGDRFRIAINWNSSVSCQSISNCNFDRLDTDLDMGVIDPDWQWVPSAWSASWDNNYELVEFVATKTGTYTIAVKKARADESFNYLGIALLQVHPVYLPIVLKSP